MPENPLKEKKFNVEDVLVFGTQETYQNFMLINNRYFVVTSKRIVEINKLDGNT